MMIKRVKSVVLSAVLFGLMAVGSLAAAQSEDGSSVGFDPTALDGIQATVLAFLTVGGAVVIAMVAYRLIKKAAGQSSV